MSTTERRTTVADLRERKQDALYRLRGRPDVQAKWIERLEEEIAALGDYPDDMPLMTLGEALASDMLTPAEKFVVRWQRTYEATRGEFEHLLIEALTAADEDELDRLALGYPVEVEGIRRWRSDARFARRLRGMPFAFSI